MGWIPHLSTYCQTRVDSYYYVPSCQTPKTAASRGSEWVTFIYRGEPTGMFDQGPESLPWVIE
jgi:hypothetical protein